MQSRIPPKLRNRSHRLAIDLHLIPYYGKPTEIEANYVYRSQAKAGTTRFFAYATVYAICRNKRVTLAIHAVPCTETLVATLTYLLSIIHPLRMRIKLLCLEREARHQGGRGFYSVPIIRLNLQLDRGEWLSLLGGNGYGKSTLLKLLSHLLKPQQGIVWLDGKAIHTEAPHLVAQKMALLPQQQTIPSGLTVQQLVSLGRTPHQPWYQWELTEIDLKSIEP